MRPGTLEEDVWRRDFTVNSLCQSLDGEVIDITGQGLADLVAGGVAHPARPGGDLRRGSAADVPGCAFCGPGWASSLPPGTIEAMRAQAGRISILSIERVSDEIRRMLVAPYPSAGIRGAPAMPGSSTSCSPNLLPLWGSNRAAITPTTSTGTRSRRSTLPRLDLVTSNRGAAPRHRQAPAARLIAPDGRHTFYDHPQIGADMAHGDPEPLAFQQRRDQ